MWRMSVGPGGAGDDAGGPPAMPTIHPTITARPTGPMPIGRTIIDRTRFIGRTIGPRRTTGRTIIDLTRFTARTIGPTHTPGRTIAPYSRRTRTRVVVIARQAELR